LQQIQFYREGIHNYMLLSSDMVVDRNTYSSTLLELVDVPGFMKYDIRVLDDQSVFYYKLRYRTSLKQVLGDIQLTIEKMERVLGSIVEVLYQTENYLLNPEYVMWRSDTTFVEVNSGRLLFSYYPVKNGEQNSIKDFLIELIQFVDKRDEHVYLYVMEFYNLITNPDCDIYQLIQFVQQGKRDRGISSDREEVVYDTFGSDKKPLVDGEEQQVVIVDDKFKEENQKKIKKEELANGEKIEKSSWLTIGILTVINLIVVFLLLLEIWTYQYIWVLAITFIFLLAAIILRRPLGEEKEMDQIMEEYLTSTASQESLSENKEKTLDYNVEKRYEETTILTLDQQEIVVEDKPQELYLKSMNPKKYSDLIMKKSSMVIGSMKNGCDYILSEKGISRMHTKLIKKEDGLYAFDMNSTNQTYLNEEPLISGKEYLLKEGDILCLAGIVCFVVMEREI